MPDTTQKVRKTDSIFKTIAKNPDRPFRTTSGQTPAPTVENTPQPAATTTVVPEGQQPTGQTAPAAPVQVVEAPTQTPVQEQTPVAGTQEPQDIVVDDPEATIVVNGERIKAKDAMFFGKSRARQLQEEQRIAEARKEVQSLVGDLNEELSDPVIKDYRNLRASHPEWTPEQVRDAALRANGVAVPAAPTAPPEEPLPEAPAGAVPGDKEWNDWMAQVASIGADRAIKKHVAPLTADIEARKQAEERKQAADRIATQNINLVNTRTQEFTHVNLADLADDEHDVFYNRVGEVLAKRGYALDGKTNRWNTKTGTIDENIYALAVEAAWPEGTSPKKKASAPGPQTPAGIVTEHMNNGLGLIPDKRPTPTPTPPSGAMQTQTPMKQPRQGRRSNDPAGEFMRTGKLQSANQ